MRYSSPLNIRYIRISVYILTLLCFCACSLTKYVPDGEYLVKSVTVRTDNKNVKPGEVKHYVKQEPNHKTFGFIPFPLYLYNLSGQDTTKWFNRFLRRAGNAPEIYNPELTQRSEREILQLLANKGYVDAAVEVNLEKKKKKISVEYVVAANKPLQIDEFCYNIPNDTIRRIVCADTTASLIKEGALLDRNILEQERVRLTTRIRNRGYWGFNKDFINYTADTTSNSSWVDLELNIQPKLIQKENGDYVKEAHHPYYIDKVYFLTDYDPMNVSRPADMMRDTVSYKGYDIIYGKEHYLRPETLIENCFITPGALYSDRMVDATYASFARLRILKYVNIRFIQSPDNENEIVCYILLTPGKNQSVQTELEGTNTAADFGFAAAMTYQHRNIFKGSETLTTKVRGGYENLTGDADGLIVDDYIEYGGEVAITFPKFMFPMMKNDFKRRIRATTEVSANYSYQRRPEYRRVIAGGGLKYHWLTNRNRYRHYLDLIDISYVYLPYRSEAFIDSIINKNPIAYSSYKDHLISRTAYTFYQSNFNPAVRNKDIYTLRASTEIAGNTLYALSNVFNFKKTDNAYTIGGLRFEQYWKFDVDYAFTKVLSEKNSVAFHIAGGVGVPYGNSKVLPFEKRYYSGGANSVRGWSVRTLGPGRYYSDNPDLDYFNQCGDIRFDASIEYRTRLFWKLELAAFVDAGNVWTIRNYENQPGGLFALNSFYKEIAMSWGLGMRFDFNYFILRLDLGVKAYDPALIDSNPWVINDPLNRRNQQLHFAVGYPF